VPLVIWTGLLSVYGPSKILVMLPFTSKILLVWTTNSRSSYLQCLCNSKFIKSL
jgi:hypothetical protein